MGSKKVSISLGRGFGSCVQERQGSTTSETQTKTVDTKRRKRSRPAGGIKECFLEEGKIDHGLKSWHGFDRRSIIHNFCLSVKISLK